VIVALLDQLGVSAEAVESGEEALGRVGKNDYDLILMDLQMPVLDGLEAIRLIRELPGRSDVPIVAMTAQPSQPEIEACRAAGASDCICMPISPAKIHGVLVRWLAPRQRPQRRPKMSGERYPPNAVPDLPAIPGVSVALGLRSVGGDLARYMDLLRELVRSHRGVGARACALLDQGAPEQVRVLARELKGVAGTLGATRIQALAGGLDGQLSDGDLGERMRRIAGSLDRELAILDAALETLPADSGPIAPDEDREPVDGVLERIAVLLRADDLAALRVCEASRSLLRAHFGDRGRVLEELVQAFDFPQAAAILEGLRRAEESRH
jgi:CheY-like chemotaxis protein